MILPDADPRLMLLAEWLATALRSSACTLAPASEDASFRRYFRVTLKEPCALAPGAAAAQPPLAASAAWAGIEAALPAAGSCADIPAAPAAIAG